MCDCSLVTQYNYSLSSFVLNFRNLTQVVAAKFLTEKNDHNYFMYYIRVKKRKKMRNDRKMRISILIPIYTVHFAFRKVYTKI